MNNKGEKKGQRQNVGSSPFDSEGHFFPGLVSDLPQRCPVPSFYFYFLGLFFCGTATFCGMSLTWIDGLIVGVLFSFFCKFVFILRLSVGLASLSLTFTELLLELRCWFSSLTLLGFAVFFHVFFYGFERVLNRSSKGFYWIILGYTRVLLGFTGVNWV